MVKVSKIKGSNLTLYDIHHLVKKNETGIMVTQLIGGIFVLLQLGKVTFYMNVLTL